MYSTQQPNIMTPIEFVYPDGHTLRQIRFRCPLSDQIMWLKVDGANSNGFFDDLLKHGTGLETILLPDNLGD